MVTSINSKVHQYSHVYHDLPSTITLREGKLLNISGDQWLLPYAIKEHSTIDFSKISNVTLQLAVKHFVKDRLERVSTHAGYSAFSDIWREIIRHGDISSTLALHELEVLLISVVSAAISRARIEHQLWRMYRPVQWYIWCAEHYPEYGFSPVYATELEAISIPGCPKGEAVRSEDPDAGPLHRSLELPLLIQALKHDTSTDFQHLQQKVVVALSIAFGRNPANLTFLREDDFVDLTPKGEERCYMIRMPRIKKRLLDPRDDFVEEYIDPMYAKYLTDLCRKNQEIKLNLNFDGTRIQHPRPLLIKQSGNKAAILAKDWNNAYNMTSNDISILLKSFVERHNIMSPQTGKLLNISPRRLRYTLASCLAEEGISKSALARILDHSDTQHVQVYFEIAGNVVNKLDKAVSNGFSQYLQFFRGNVVEDDQDAVNGDREDKHLQFIHENNPTDQSSIGVCGENSVCHLDPPYSCYLCPKFQPYRHADHQHVLDCLLTDREQRLQKYDNARLGIQLDQVIAAVIQVVQICQKEAAHV